MFRSPPWFYQHGNCFLCLCSCEWEKYVCERVWDPVFCVPLKSLAALVWGEFRVITWLQSPIAAIVFRLRMQECMRGQNYISAWLLCTPTNLQDMSPQRASPRCHNLYFMALRVCVLYIGTAFEVSELWWVLQTYGLDENLLWLFVLPWHMQHLEHGTRWFCAAKLKINWNFEQNHVMTVLRKSASCNEHAWEQLFSCAANCIAVGPASWLDLCGRRKKKQSDKSQDCSKLLRQSKIWGRLWIVWN